MNFSIFKIKKHFHTKKFIHFTKCFLFLGLLQSVALASTNQEPFSPNRTQILVALEEGWKNSVFNEQKTNLWRHINQSDVTIKDCRKVSKREEGLPPPDHLCLLEKIPEQFKSWIEYDDNNKENITAIISLHWEDNRWQLKPIFIKEPTNEEILHELNRVWLYEKYQTYQKLINNRQWKKDYAPTPGRNTPQTENDFAHKKRKKKLSALPDTPFLEHPIRTHCEPLASPRQTSPSMSYKCTLNTEDLEKAFPFFAKRNKKAIKSYEKDLKSEYRSDSSSYDPRTKKYSITLTTKYSMSNKLIYNSSWVIGGTHLDPFLSTFEGIDYFDGCFTPKYRPPIIWLPNIYSSEPKNTL